MDSPKDICAICLESLRVREGQALFTAECSHTFHFSCITNNVQHGNYICPTCRATWRNLPSQFSPTSNIVPAPNFIRRFGNLQPVSPDVSSFADDEALPSSEPNISSTVSLAPTPQVHSQRTGDITVKALPEHLAFSRAEQSDSFSVLVGIRAPPLSPEASDRPDARAPVDLVAVLDISGSMNGQKIRLLKQAMGFVVDNLGPTDRLSVISFATSALRVTPLRRMTDAGRADTMQAVNSLRANGSTNIIAGLKMAVRVLEQRRQKNPVASMILLSDGQDNQNEYGAQFLHSLRFLPPCIRTNDADQTPQTQTDVVPVAVHTFGFGSDHDAAALHEISDGSGGTFSYIESIEIIQDAFAQCIGGLLSVVAQDVQIHAQSGSVGVRVQSISSGRYRNRIENEPVQLGVVYLEDVYAEEEKQFLVNLSVPLASASSAEETDALTTKLLEVKCSYKDPICNESIMSETVTVEILRPQTENLSEVDRQVCLEVDRERNRISIAEGIAQAQAMADRGELEEARGLLGQRRMKLFASSSAQAGDSFSGLLDSDVTEIEARMGSRAEYEGGGKAFAYSKRSSHNFQRASTQAVPIRRSRLQIQPTSMDGCTSGIGAFNPFSAHAAPSSGYQTSFMQKMVNKSQELRFSSNLISGKQSGGSSNSN